MSLATELQQLRDRALAELREADTPEQLEQWRIRYLARKGKLAGMMSTLGALAPDEKRQAGQVANTTKSVLTEAHEEALSALKARAAKAGQVEDVTLPGITPVTGGLHLTRQTLYEIIRIFGNMGFTVFETSEVETDEYNFELLNIPRDHPARDMWDTMYISDDLLLRTHTSPGQIRAMRKYYPEPIRVLLPGKCYRYEAISARADFMFYQVEGLAVGHNITLASLKGVFEALAQQMYGGERQVRFRGSYFPFTEPSVEIDITCNCLGKGCRLCKGSGWLEISGGGMVHPVVLENGGYDPDEFTGFAFGMGVERPAMLKHNIDDIRYFYGNDLRFLEQFT